MSMGMNLVENVVAQLRVTLFLWLPLICSICSAWFYLLLEIPYYALGNHHSFEEEGEEGANSLLHLKWGDSRIYWTLNWLHVSTDDSSSSTNWLDLPDHIVSSHIANRLTRLKDFVQFGAVCRSWRCIYINSQSSRSPKVPFLMVANATQLNSDDQTRGLYSLIDKRVICNSQVQIPHKMHCPGSSHGWVFIVCPKTLQIRILNPFLPSDKNQIHLPPITAFEHNDDNYAAGLLRKAVLSADPVLEPTNFIILAIESGRLDGVLSFYKPGDKAWTSIDSQFEMITDVIYYRDKFVVVNLTGYVFSIDLNHPKPKVLTIAIRPPLKRGADKRYLVELSGDLLQILRYCTDEEDANSSCPTIGFDVFKLDQFNHKWILLDNLGGHILFLGDNSTYCVSASDLPECEPNSIYFTDGYTNLYTDRDEDEEVNGVGPLDMGVYHFEDRTIKPYYSMESKMIYPVPIFIQPPSCT